MIARRRPRLVGGTAVAAVLFMATTALAQTPGAPARPALSAASEADWTKPVSVVISVVAAIVGFVSLMMSRRSQTVGFQKDAAAIVRDIRAKRANAVIQAFENNVARPIGMVLDQIERLAADMTKLAQVPAEDVDAAAKKYGSQLAADNANLLRLCREADGGLATGRAPVFMSAYAAALLDAVLFRAGYETLSGTRPARQSAGAEAMDAVGAVKVKLRQLLEAERIALIEAQTGSIVDDPYYPQLQKLLGNDFARLSDAGAIPPPAPDGVHAGQRQA